ncbi:MAG: hypothetical protein ACI92G_001525 [Candidatus Pelagisphaera sp.]|jgi:hypothetical protein
MYWFRAMRSVSFDHILQLNYTPKSIIRLLLVSPAMNKEIA